MTRHQIRLGVMASACYWAVLLGAVAGGGQQYVSNVLYWLIAHFIAMLLGFVVLALGMLPPRRYEPEPPTQVEMITYECDVFERS